MAGRLLHKLFGSTAPPDVLAALDELERLANERPELAPSIALLRDFLPILYQEPVLDPLPSLPGDHALAKLGGGVSLLRGEPVQLDMKAFRQCWQQLCRAMQRHHNVRGVDRLAEALQDDVV